jgi:hypothetical protein
MLDHRRERDAVLLWLDSVIANLRYERSSAAGTMDERKPITHH